MTDYIDIEHAGFWNTEPKELQFDWIDLNIEHNLGFTEPLRIKRYKLYDNT